MHKNTKFTVVFLILVIVFGAGVGYYYIPTTLMFILLIGIVFLGVLGLYLVLKSTTEDVDQRIIFDEEVFPEIEDALIYVTPQDFASKVEREEGSLFVVGEQEKNNITLKNASFDKLTDELNILFNSGEKLQVKGIKTLGVGDRQFLLFGFATLAYFKNKKRIALFEWDDSYLKKQTTSDEVYALELPNGYPVVVFSW